MVNNWYIAKSKVPSFRQKLVLGPTFEQFGGPFECREEAFRRIFCGSNSEFIAGFIVLASSRTCMEDLGFGPDCESRSRRPATSDAVPRMVGGAGKR